MIELLELRRLLSASVMRAASAADQPLRRPTEYRSELLTAHDVSAILAQAASQAARKQVIVVVDREGIVRGAVQVGGIRSADPSMPIALPELTYGKALARARTAALFQSTQNAFTTRSARFIIQDHFPQPIQNTPGGPLYGVEFSSQPASDVPLAEAKDNPSPLNISGDPGGIPLYKNGIPVGGIGAAGDGRDVAVREDLIPVLAGQLKDPSIKPGRFFRGREESDLDEQVALAGASGFMAPREIRSDRIFLDGLRVPFTQDKPAARHTPLSLGKLEKAGRITVLTAPQAAQLSPYPYKPLHRGGEAGEFKNPDSPDFGTMDDPLGKLTKGEVEQIIQAAVDKARALRAGIREPQGVSTRVHIAVVNREGTILGVFRMADGTNFSFDVAVQKARTAAFFSDDSHALSTRAVGFVAQKFFPPGINSTGPGPLYAIQNALSLNAANFKAPLANGITIFPGGVPLYRRGKLIGAIGISGDGVDQDDTIAFAGGARYAPPKSIRSDHLSQESVVQLLDDKLQELSQEFDLPRKQRVFSTTRIRAGLDRIRLPYVKFPRNPYL